MTFFATEMGTHTSIDKKGRMIIKGRLQPHNIERPLNSYINQYVKCHMCRKYTTHFKKDPNTRLLFLECDLCGSSRSVNQIRSLYHATSRADRIQAKKAAAS
ncbi:translation initiation factor eIF-2 beta subunit [Bonamia ostreae]|uniref:Translation initiation factor eIF-2 beta subunit n=1 Tax=Bonamia ostreae TaxID=126728 RepID=A0ABV2AV81_9EUKA